MMKGGEAGAATTVGFGEASASPMGASTEAEVDAATKAGLVGAATSPMMVMAGLVGTAASLMEASTLRRSPRRRRALEVQP
jgi:hypothetical protein